jgi:hypothetical protein
MIRSICTRGTLMGIGRRWRIGLLMSAVLVLASGGWVASNALPVGVGHKAKTLCSGVFVSRLDAQAVIEGLETDHLAVLKYIDAAVDSRARTVTASFLGVVRRVAIYREGARLRARPRRADAARDARRQRSPETPLRAFDARSEKR